MSDPTQLLPHPILAFLNLFVAACHLFNHYLGWGIGTLVFILLLVFVAMCPGICYWAFLIKSGMSSENAANQSAWVFRLLFVVFLLIGGYVLEHGGMVTHPV